MSMKTIGVLVLTAVLAAGLCSDVGSAPEYRSAWVTSWSRGFYTAEEIDRTIADAETAGLNSLVVEVRKTGDAYYRSEIEPIGREVPEGFDPLAYCIEKAHAKGIRVCAWLVVYRVWRGSRPPADPKHIINQHPDWRSVNYDGKTEAGEGAYIDPGILEYREHFAKVCEDIVRRYAVDAIHFDYVRYPDRQWGYAPLALKRYYAETGATKKPEMDDPKWLQWKRDQVTAMVTLVRKRVKAVNPNVAIQASTIPWGSCPDDWTESSAYRQVCQDWRLWMQRGLIDESYPMVYSTERDPRSAERFRGWIEGCSRWSYGRDVYMGISASRNTPEEIMAQANDTENAGLAGFCLFAFNESSRRPPKAEGLGAYLCPAPKLSVIQATGNDAIAARKAYYDGMALARAGKVDAAIVELTKATQLNPGSAEAFLQVGRCYLGKGDAAQARMALDRALSIDPKHRVAKAESAKLAELP